MKKWLKHIGIQFGVTFVALALLLGIGGPLLEHAPQPVHEVVLYARFADDASALPRDATLDGNADDVEVQALLASLPSTGGKIILGAGNIRFNATVSRAINNVTIEGSGKGTYVYNNAATALFSAGAQTGWVFKDLRTDAGGLTAASDTLFVHCYIGTSPRDSTVMTGTIMPTTATAVAGQQFQQITTGRDVLYSYNGTIWAPIQSFGTMTLYVDKTDGTDDQNHGTGVDAAAYKTIQYAVNQIPASYDGDVRLYINAESYTENVTIVGHSSRNYSVIYIYGTLTVDANLVATGGVKGVGATPANVTGAFGVGAYDAHLMSFTSGANSGQYRMIGETAAGAIYLDGAALNAQPVNLDTYTIYHWGTTITGKVDIGPNQSQIEFWNLAFTNATASDDGAVVVWGFAYAKFYQCSISTTGAETAIVFGQASGELFDCLISVTGGYIGARLENHSSPEFNGVMFDGNDTAGSHGIRVLNASVSTVRSGCEIRDFAVGQYELDNSTSTFWTPDRTTFIHSNTSYGVAAVSSSSASNTGAAAITYGIKLSGGADVNTLGNESADAVSFSYID